MSTVPEFYPSPRWAWWWRLAREEPCVQFFREATLAACKVPGRASRAFWGSVVGVETPSPVTALTFDDGPHPEYTQRLLEILSRHGAKATFFMIGERAHQYPDLVRQVAEEGHTIGNHSWNHHSLPRLDHKGRRDQWINCAKAIEPYGSSLFRPPYGHQTPTTRLEARALGYEVVMWTETVDGGCHREVDTFVNQISGQLRPGSILSLNDGVYDDGREDDANREAMLAALDWVLAEREHHHRFVTLPELFRCGRKQRKLWFRDPFGAWPGGSGGDRGTVQERQQ
jgi:peptidoglycan-N-acetylglucosamine deacetylase